MLDQKTFNDFQKYHVPGEIEFMVEVLPDFNESSQYASVVVFIDKGEWKVMPKGEYQVAMYQLMNGELSAREIKWYADDIPIAESTTALRYEIREELGWSQ